ncbi:MAG: hypothetical protein AUI97_07890 [Crenarchaeota archaeon 13_1_40CM_3_52_17]|nr:MAG: hypothetical protein AUI97_07890 [Crenarchaeota archaeon 13_1_40CM_3_52_17]
MMRKLGITTIASFAVNVILSLWLVNQYFYDVYFHSYVDATLGPVYPFIVLTAGLGGGSSLGYLLLKRRHGGDETGRLEKARLFKSSGPVQTPGSLASPQGKIMPTGPPPGQVSRHTAYAVPPLPKSSPSTGGGTRGTVPSSMAVSSKNATSISTSQRLDQITQPSTSILNSTLRDQYRPEQTARPMPSVPPPSAPVRGEGGGPVNRIPPEPSRMSFPSQWKPEPDQPVERRPDAGNVFPRPSPVDQKTGSESPGFGGPVGQVPKPPQASQTPFPVSKWVAPDQRGNQWTDPVPKPGLAAPQKWAPPPSQGVGPRPPPQGGPPRPGSGPAPGPPGQRPQFPPGQGPRPLGYPPGRPGQPGPVGVAPSFRSDQPRPPGPPPQGRPVQSPGGPLPHPWSPPKPAEKGDAGGGSQDKDLFGSPPRTSQPRGSEEPRETENKAGEQGSPGGEMDWDTALDTILKTLKKDRGVGESR